MTVGVVRTSTVGLLWASWGEALWEGGFLLPSASRLVAEHEALLVQSSLSHVAAIPGASQELARFPFPAASLRSLP